MATFFLDPENGNDASAGNTFATRWKTFTSGATSARVAAGDTVRIISTPDPTLIGTASWTNANQEVTLPAAATRVVNACDTAWTSSNASVTTSTSTNRKNGSFSNNFAVLAGFTTGKMATQQIGGGTPIDLSLFTRISFFITSNFSLPAGSLSLRLCSDTAGDTAVHTIPIPAIGHASIGYWQTVVWDNAAALNSVIQSITLFGNVDPGNASTMNFRLDDIVACLPATSANALTHNSLIGKELNLYWQPSAAYVLDKRRRPSAGARNGFIYRCTIAGTSGASEPSWPIGIGATVTDGSVSWICEDIEETWWPIAGLAGDKVFLDADPISTPAQRFGYAGTTESVATYRLEPTLWGVVGTNQFSGNGTFARSGTAAAPVLISGGWDRTAMSAQTGESWIGYPQGMGAGLSFPNSATAIVIENIGFMRCDKGLTNQSGEVGTFTLRNLHFSGNVGASDLAGSNLTGQGLVAVGNGSNAHAYSFKTGKVTAIRGDANGFSGATVRGGICMSRSINVNWAKTVGNMYSLHFGLYGISEMYLSNWTAANTQTSGIILSATNSGESTATRVINNLNVAGESFAVSNLVDSAFTTNFNGRYHLQRVNGIADDNRIYLEGGNIQSVTDVRNSASGIAWRFSPTNIIRTAVYPLSLCIARIAVGSGAAVSVRVMTRRSLSSVKGRMRIAGGSLQGIRSDILVACEPTTNTWVQSDPLTFTPTEAGVVEIFFDVWDGVATTGNYWIDDVSVQT